jgi:hypothetical protein
MTDRLKLRCPDCDKPLRAHRNNKGETTYTCLSRSCEVIECGFDAKRSRVIWVNREARVDIDAGRTLPITTPAGVCPKCGDRGWRTHRDKWRFYCKACGQRWGGVIDGVPVKPKY